MKEKKKHSFQLKDVLMPSSIFLVAANLLPFYGVLYLGWKVFPLLLLFWIENIIVGVFNVLRMLFCDPKDPLKWLGKLFMIPFFTFHYGMFTGVHGLFVILMFGGLQITGGPDEAFKKAWPLIFEYRLFYAVFGLVASHAFSFIMNYILKGEYLKESSGDLMGKPYSRVVILHVTIIIGGFLMMALRSPETGLLFLLVLKICFDLNAHIREHKKTAEKLVKSTW
ncbi:MAG: hypothetical protein JW928_04280 [Candidatus Aureabacteria bacterium]|nr:hypothetical protein [Candidatus Auribacterota bacterium]